MGLRKVPDAMKTGPLAVLLFSLCASFHGEAATISYRLLDHPGGSQSAPGSEYGLRLDTLISDGLGPLFSVQNGGAQVLLIWDQDNDTATITGTIYDNANNTLWNVVHRMVNVVTAGGGFIADAGTMNLSGPNNQNYEFVGKQDGSGVAFAFLDDSHRCYGANDCGPFVGRGWLSRASGATQGINDWLVQAVLVPIPGPLVLLSSGLLLLALRPLRNNRSSASLVRA
ncbi:MAG: hypothetical protein AAF384_02070 [Pseudomonadota bacterium]